MDFVKHDNMMSQDIIKKLNSKIEIIILHNRFVTGDVMTKRINFAKQSSRSSIAERWYFEMW